MHSSIKIANYLLQKAVDNDNTITPMQLIKLVYMSHGWMLGIYGNPLIEDDIEAWQYGPVIPDLYHKVKKFRSSPVEGPLSCSDNKKLDGKEKDILDQVYELYGNYSGIALSRITHADGTPWSITWALNQQGALISNDLIQSHYSELAAA